MNRLFLFAAYNKNDKISKTLLDYLELISKLGDIILCFDSDVSKAELKKLGNISHILHVSGVRHGEYDFGSYKRAYQYAASNKLLAKYEYIYLVNDSVYCLNLPEYLLTDLEQTKNDLLGMVKYADAQTPEYMQSWFLGITSRVATADFMAEFMNNITRQTNKNDIVLKYEIMFSRIIVNHGFKMSATIPWAHDTTIVYKNPYSVLNGNVPFVKKKAIRYIGDLNRLALYAASDKIVKNIIDDVTTQGIQMETNRYRCAYKLAVFGLPVFRRMLDYNDRVAKGYLFGVRVYKSIRE
ncbi:MAG: hypothetical protein J6T57_00250 [Alphaproteobacteria bacterium]|nr:hypothetical protein [Alphaproteobacteria bacterium]